LYVRTLWADEYNRTHRLITYVRAQEPSFLSGWFPFHPGWHIATLWRTSAPVEGQDH